MSGKSQLASSFDPKFEFVRVLDPTRNFWVESLGAKLASNSPRARVGASWIRVNPTRSAQYALLFRIFRAIFACRVVARLHVPIRVNRRI